MKIFKVLIKYLHFQVKRKIYLYFEWIHSKSKVPWVHFCPNTQAHVTKESIMKDGIKGKQC